MPIPPSYTVSPAMLNLVSQIDAIRLSLHSPLIKPVITKKIQHISTLKSSLFSARIEGATAQFEELDEQRPEQQEIFNILKAIQYIQASKPISIDDTLLFGLHSYVMSGVRGATKHFRTEQNAIFNQAGVAVYVPPSPPQISVDTQKLYSYIYSSAEPFPLIAAIVSHLIFEKIHPFIDGNGRVGRLLIMAICVSRGYDFGMYIPIEEYLDYHKDAYYYHLDQGMVDTAAYITFMLEGYVSQAERIQALAEQEQVKPSFLSSLSPRQEEIYVLIREHTVASFDVIRRRFLRVPERTLRYDLQKLCERKIIVKAGTTRGTYYRINDNQEL
ncbi:Dot/Icm type IV secretion system effector CoxFIC1 [soil metagenome]